MNVSEGSPLLFFVILNEVKNLGRTVFRPIQTKILHFVQNDKKA